MAYFELACIRSKDTQSSVFFIHSSGNIFIFLHILLAICFYKVAITNFINPLDEKFDMIKCIAVQSVIGWLVFVKKFLKQCNGTCNGSVSSVDVSTNFSCAYVRSLQSYVPLDLCKRRCIDSFVVTILN